MNPHRGECGRGPPPPGVPPFPRGPPRRRRGRGWGGAPRAPARRAPPAGGAGEAMAAGFTRAPDPPLGVVRGRAGFEAGGPADVMAPCSVLAELTGQAAGRMGELSDDELIRVLRAARRVRASAAPAARDGPRALSAPPLA